ncbi:unnamed protein product [Paramecium octaurelia]|uniref:Uncharacterized protein n=1 Tax=Paramecium octaurelia TaxID=43137 RepID=A0A8S1S6I5_PAROT|nr:unnamed protein product [Paramecium octaurelia]
MCILSQKFLSYAQNNFYQIKNFFPNLNCLQNQSISQNFIQQQSIIQIFRKYLYNTFQWKEQEIQKMRMLFRKTQLVKPLRSASKLFEFSTYKLIKLLGQKRKLILIKLIN